MTSAENAPGLVDLNELEEIRPTPPAHTDPLRDAEDRMAAARAASGAPPEVPPDPSPSASPPPAASPPPQPPAQPRQVPPVVQGQAPASAPPVQDDDPEWAKKRINRLYGQKKAAEETNELYAEQIKQLQSEIAALRSPPQQQSSGFELDLGTPQSSPQPSAGYVSRDELKGLFREFAQEISASQQLANAQRTARAEVEQEFAQELRDPQFQAVYEDILSRDPSVSSDPNGPLRAAFTARGILADHLYSKAGTASPDARKQALSGVGPSVPEGSSSPPSDRQSRYQQALAYAKHTGQDRDFARALQIMRGEL